MLDSAPPIFLQVSETGLSEPTPTAMPTQRLLSTLLALAALPAVSRAGDFHIGDTKKCSDCHVVHLASVPGFDGGKSEVDVGPLLKKDINNLCLSCHDDSPRAVDVLGTNMGRHRGIVRQAGFLSRVGLGGSPAGGHTLDSLETAPGSDPPWKPGDENRGGGGLNCVNCHQSHGTMETYRNLRPDAGNNRGLEGLVTYNHGHPGSNDLTRDVFVRRTGNYDEAAVDFNEPNQLDSAMGRFCAGCHNEFHGRPGDPRTVGGERGGNSFSKFLRHPDAGVNLGKGRADQSSSLERFASHRTRVKVMSEVGVWSNPGPDVTPTCISCHKAHGNSNAFGLIYRSGHGRPTENGDTAGNSLEHLCGQCHGEASTFAKP